MFVKHVPASQKKKWQHSIFFLGSRNVLAGQNPRKRMFWLTNTYVTKNKMYRVVDIVENMMLKCMTVLLFLLVQVKWPFPDTVVANLYYPLPCNLLGLGLGSERSGQDSVNGCDMCVGNYAMGADRLLSQ